MKRISAADANRHFSKLLRDVAAGETVIVTSRGKPVARIVPEPGEDSKDEARQALLEHLSGVTPLGLPRTWTRDELYDDDD